MINMKTQSVKTSEILRMGAWCEVRLSEYQILLLFHFYFYYPLPHPQSSMRPESCSFCFCLPWVPKLASSLSRRTSLLPPSDTSCPWVPVLHLAQAITFMCDTVLGNTWSHMWLWPTDPG